MSWLASMGMAGCLPAAGLFLLSANRLERDWD